MVTSIYLTSAEGRTGKSAVALGLLDALLVDAPRVGVFRPLIRSGAEPDRVLELLRSRATAQLDYEQCIGVTYEAVQDDPDAALAEIVRSYQQLKAHCDAVLVVGSDYTDVAAPTELTFNARAAANLDAPIVLVLGGRSQNAAESLGQTEARTPSEIGRVAELCWHGIEAEHATLIAAVVNRADPDALDDIALAVREELPAALPIWTLPERVDFVAPHVSTVLAAVEGELVRGRSEMLHREVHAITIAGMSMEHVLPQLIERSVLVIAADRAETLLAVMMAHEASTFPSLSGVVLNGGFELAPVVERLLDGIDSELPIIRTELGTFETAQRITGTRGLLRPGDNARADQVIELFRSRVDTVKLRAALVEHQGGVRTPTMFSYEVFELAARANAHIVLPEGDDDRVLRAAAMLLSRGTVRLTLLGDEREVRRRAEAAGLTLDAAAVIDPETSPLREQFAERYAELRAHRGVAYDIAFERMGDVSYFGTMMVHLGHADGMVSGATHTTAHTIRPALEIIRTAPGLSVVSSVFFMALADRVLVYGDCAVNPEPTAAELADIAVSSAATAAQFGVEPRVAMLSYSTGESGAGADVEKVRSATELVRAAHPDLLVEGPMQYDAAIDPATGALKLPGSQVAGRATVFIFPDLNTGNNTYKAVQRSAGAIAIGPVLQGLNKPINDLSRGATVQDIINTVAITAVQAGAAAQLSTGAQSDTAAQRTMQRHEEEAP